MLWHAPMFILVLGVIAASSPRLVVHACCLDGGVDFALSLFDVSACLLLWTWLGTLGLVLAHGWFSMTTFWGVDWLYMNTFVLCCVICQELGVIVNKIWLGRICVPVPSAKNFAISFLVTWGTRNLFCALREGHIRWNLIPLVTFQICLFGMLCLPLVPKLAHVRKLVW